MPRLHLTSRLRPGASLRGTSGNVSILFALSLVPMIGLVGLGVDYGVALSVKAKLDNAADAAAIAAVATAKAYVAANPTDANLNADAAAAGQAQAVRAFTVNAGSLPFATVPTPTIPLPVRTGQTFSATVSYQTQTSNNFGKLFAQPVTTISGNTAASADIPSYLDFYLLIDVSASMGLPSLLQDQNTLALHNNGCQFACHFPDQQSGYNYAVNNNLQLRSGSVNSAVCGLLALAAAPTVPNQYRVGLYPFITQMATLSPISSNYSVLSAAATCNQSPPTKFTTLLDSGATQVMTGSDTSTGVGSGGTHFEAPLTSIQNTISPYQDGSSALKSRPFVFLITDGMENTQYFDIVQNGKNNYPGGSSLYQQSGRSWWTGTNPGSMSSVSSNLSQCAALKSAGATISILYIPYTVLTVTNQNTWETQTADNAIPQIPTDLQTCASPGYFYTANTPTDIKNALAAMFNQAVQAAHLLK